MPERATSCPTRAASLAANCEELAEGNRLTRLCVGGERQTSVRTAFDHSDAVLKPVVARLFALLGLHPGRDFTAEVAVALLGAAPAAAKRLLEQFVTARLVQRTAAGRFQFHAPLRLSAAVRASADPDRAEAWQRLCPWRLAVTDAATAFDYSGRAQLSRPHPASDRFADREQASAWLDEERVNLVAVICHAAQAGPRVFAWQLTDQLRMCLYRCRHQREWEAAATAAL
ncbi:hypothetical protein AB0H82_11065 [Streptomyces sp. NPDC050732]|uniref:hypothetical protein n=1 Tax=Streptomyces sp. NPDC050732 TaxID=3154632 RepID=UPI00343C246B